MLKIEPSPCHYGCLSSKEANISTSFFITKLRLEIAVMRLFLYFTNDLEVQKYFIKAKQNVEFSSFHLA